MISVPHCVWMHIQIVVHLKMCTSNCSLPQHSAVMSGNRWRNCVRLSVIANRTQPAGRADHGTLQEYLEHASSADHGTFQGNLEHASSADNGALQGQVEHASSADNGT